MLLLFLGRASIAPPVVASIMEWWIRMWNPYNKAIAITKSDTDNFFPSTAQSGGWATSEAIFVGAAGVVAAVFQDGSVVEFTAVAGEILPIRCIRVNSTNTTADKMVAMYTV